jgi:HlyD family secretion protein
MRLMGYFGRHRRAFVLATAIALLATAFAFRDFPFGSSTSRPSLLVSGNIEAHQSVLSFKLVQSRIVELPFNEGQWVEAGTLLARLDDSNYRQQAAIDEAALTVRQRQLAATFRDLEAAQQTVVADQADVRQKTLDFGRQRVLWKTGATSTQSRDLADAALKQSQAALLRDQAIVAARQQAIEVARANVRHAEEVLALSKILLNYTVLRAPFSGVILVRQTELGEVMLPGTPVVTLADLDHVWLRAYINETDLAKVRLGQSATLRTDSYPDKGYQGRISFISSAAEFTPKSVETHAERVTLVYRIKIDVDNPDHELKPGMPADATIELAPGQTHD